MDIGLQSIGMIIEKAGDFKLIAPDPIYLR